MGATPQTPGTSRLAPSSSRSLSPEMPSRRRSWIAGRFGPLAPLGPSPTTRRVDGRPKGRLRGLVGFWVGDRCPHGDVRPASPPSPPARPWRASPRCSATRSTARCAPRISWGKSGAAWSWSCSSAVACCSSPASSEGGALAQTCTARRVRLTRAGRPLGVRDLHDHHREPRRRRRRSSSMRATASRSRPAPPAPLQGVTVLDLDGPADARRRRRSSRVRTQHRPLASARAARAARRAAPRSCSGAAAA